MKQKRFFVDAKTLPDSWFQLVYGILDYGREFKIDEGSFAGHTRLEFDWVDVHIERPYLRDSDGLPLLPEMPETSDIPAPTDKSRIANYTSQYIMGHEISENESYTYGQRINKYPVSDEMSDDFLQKKNIYKGHLGNPQFENVVFDAEKYVSQVETIIWTYKNKGYRNNQMILQIAEPTDIMLKDPPCLRLIDTRIQDDFLHFYIYFRSWDLWSGYPENLAGISILHEYMASEIGVLQGEFICSSKGLHLYDFSVDFAKMRCLKE